MPFDGNGSFTPAVAPGYPAVPGQTILAEQFNRVVLDITANGLTNVITRDGQSPPTANLPMAGQKLTGLAAGTAAGDSIRYEQFVDALINGTMQYLTGVAGSDTITATLTGMTAYTAGQQFLFKPVASNSNIATININALGAKEIVKYVTQPLSAGDLLLGGMAVIAYNGTKFELLNPANINLGFGAVSIYNMAESTQGFVLENGYFDVVMSANAATITLKTKNSGVSSTTITSGGSGYTTPPLVSFVGGVGSGARGYAVLTAGVVTSIVLTTPGSYTTAPSVAFSGGGGTGAAATSAIGAPSFLDPVKVTFRDTSLTNGTYVSYAITSTKTFTISSGSTLGTSNGVAANITLGVLAAAGSVEIFAFYNTGALAPDENGFITTIAEGGAGAADSSDTYYSTTARANVPYRIVGFFTSTQATAGTWVTAASQVQLYSKPPVYQSTIAWNYLPEYTTTGGATIDLPITGTIPPTVVDIEIMFELSTNGTSDILMQLGTGASIEIVGYDYLNNQAAAGGNTITASTVGIIMAGNIAAADTYKGVITLRLQDASDNTWYATNIAKRANSAINSGDGDKALAAVLTRIRVTTAGGVNTFDVVKLRLRYR